MKMRMLIGGGLIMSLVECHPKTRQATVSQAQEVTNLHQHQCAWASIGARTSASIGASASAGAGVSALVCTNTAQNHSCNTQCVR